MWAGSLLLRIGEQRDLLVAVRADTEFSLDRLRTLFEPWLDLAPVDEALTIEPAFSVRLEPIDGRRRERGAGLQLLPQLRFGSRVMVRSRQPEAVLRALAQVLGGAHLYGRNDGRTWMGMRPFVRGDVMVLVDLDRPAMVNDRQLAQSGVEERAVWSTVVESDGSVLVPPPLADLAWESVGVEPPGDGWQRFHLAGIAVLQDHEVSPAELVARVAGRGVRAHWFTSAAAMAEAGTLAGVTDRSALRYRVRMLLGSAALTN